MINIRHVSASNGDVKQIGRDRTPARFMNYHHNPRSISVGREMTYQRQEAECNNWRYSWPTLRTRMGNGWRHAESELTCPFLRPWDGSEPSDCLRLEELDIWLPNSG